MKLLIKQKLFSWLDSFDIFDEDGNTVYTVKGELDFHTVLHVYDASGNEIGYILEKSGTVMEPEFDVYVNGAYVGRIKRELSLFRHKFDIDYMGWIAKGNIGAWKYTVSDGETEIATIGKEIWKLTDTYAVNVHNKSDVLSIIMLVLAIDADQRFRTSIDFTDFI